MDFDEEDKDYVYCSHCDEVVSRSTFKRHERKRYTGGLVKESEQSRQNFEPSSSSDEEECVLEAPSVANVDNAAEDSLGANESEDNPGTVNDTANFPSDSESEADQYSSGDEYRRNADDESSSDGDSEEIWNGVLPEMLTRDIENPPPLPKPQMPPTTLQKVNSLVFWFVYFLLIWQATCHLSDNGLAWLLRFIVSWLKVLGIEVSNEVFEERILAFPGSLYLVRKFLNVDRDNFTKFVVCPKCTKLYEYGSCLTMIGNRQVAKKCSNTYYLRGKSMTCNATMVTKVILQNGKACFYPIKYYCSNSVIDELEKFLLRKNFASKCELWRNRNIAEDILADVYNLTGLKNKKGQSKLNTKTLFGQAFASLSCTIYPEPIFFSVFKY